MRGYRLFLIGPMGSGKSTVGRALAARLGTELVDLDDQVVTRAGRSIPEIFEAEGEAGFRDYEEAALAAIAERQGPLVVATGGGVVLRSANRQRMAASGVRVYLRASVAELLRRIGNDSNRPLLQTEDPAQRLADLQAEREPLYNEAELIVATDGRTTQEVADTVLARLDED